MAVHGLSRFGLRGERRKEAAWGYGLASIWIVGFLLFTLFPLGAAVFISMTNWSPVGGPFWTAHWIGGANYDTILFHDWRFWHSILNSIYYAVGSTLLANVVALPMALALNQKIRGLPFFRTVFYLPAILPAVAATLVLRLLFLPGTGAISAFLQAIGKDCNPNTSASCTNVINWFNDPSLTMPTAILFSAWAVGQPMLIYLAGLQGVDETYYEAASIDGASSWRKFLHITIPLLTPTIFFNVVVGLIGAFQEFSKIIVLAGGESTTGGPGDSLLTTLLYVYLDAFRYHLFGYATAMAFGLFLLILIFTLLNFLGQRRWVFYQEERR